MLERKLAVCHLRTKEMIREAATGAGSMMNFECKSTLRVRTSTGGWLGDVGYWRGRIRRLLQWASVPRRTD
jgi:hypothetical protein